LGTLIVGTTLLAPNLRADESKPAGRAVRLSSVEGQVRIAQDNQLLADPALNNTPLFEGTQVLTSDDGRAELQFEDGSVVRISPNSSVRLAVLRGQGATSDTEIVLEGGLGYFELQGEGSAKPIRVRFGDALATAAGFSVLRINLDSPPGELAVFSGNAHVERGTAMMLDLHGGESMTFDGRDPNHYNLAESIEPDSWDAWNADRDQVLTAAAATRTGAENNLADSNNPAWNDLDANGNWYNVPGQGYVWSPNEAADQGWDPYGNGNWMWGPQSGYMWISGEPWGYMPYQCGAWNYFNDFGWGWAPGMCQPWWGGGGWYSNIGYAPGWYRLPRRPHPGPRGPIGRPIHGPVHGLQPVAHPILPVNRHPQNGIAPLPGRNRNTPVTIAGHVVQPLRPTTQRPQYDHQATGYMNRPQPGYQGARAPGAPANAPVSPVFGGNRPGNAPVARPSPGSVGQRPIAPPAGRPSPSGSSPSHVSGGGSAPSHVSSGGGGGGGASHSSGGGGGGHH
jgi:uncharacterized membrane protein YgcG